MNNNSMNNDANVVPQTGSNNNTNSVPQTETNQPTDVHPEARKHEVKEDEEELLQQKQEFLSEAHEREENQRNQKPFIISRKSQQQGKL